MLNFTRKRRDKPGNAESGGRLWRKVCCHHLTPSHFSALLFQMISLPVFLLYFFCQHGFDVCSPSFLFLLLENSFFGLLFFPYSLLSLILIFFPLTICTGARTTVFGRLRGGIRAVWIRKRGREGIRVSRSWLREVWQGCRVKVKILEINSCFQQGRGMGMEG